MEAIIVIVLEAGRSAVDVALYTLLPIMVVTMVLLRFFEVSGGLEKFMTGMAPIARPFGLNGLGVLAMLQISFVSFVAPLPTLVLMEKRGASNRHLAAALAAILAMAPANAVFPLAVMGLNAGETLIFSLLGGLTAAATTYWLWGRKLSSEPHNAENLEQKVAEKFSVLKIINTSGAEAIQIVINIIPMLLLSLVVVTALRHTGAIGSLQALMAPVMNLIGAEPELLLPFLTKYLAGSTALVGVMHDLNAQGQLNVSLVSLTSAGFLLHPLDLPGVAILLSAGARLGKTALPAILGGVIGITLRTFLGTIIS